MTESSRRDSERDQTRVSLIRLVFTTTCETTVHEQGIYTSAITRTGSQPSDALSAGLRQCKEYGAAFSEKVHVILHALQTHVDLDCRFLAIRLSFSEFYRAKKESQAQSKS